MICNLMGANGTFVKYNTDPATRDIYEWENQGEASDKGISFNENRDMVFPIPLYEITMSNGSITQIRAGINHFQKNRLLQELNIQ